jgi:hypothetical protein
MEVKVVAAPNPLAPQEQAVPTPATVFNLAMPLGR